MTTLSKSVLPDLVRGGRLMFADEGHAQNVSVVEFNGRWFIYAKFLEELPEYNVPPSIKLFYADPGPIQAGTGTARTTFDGDSLIAHNSRTPIWTALDAENAGSIMDGYTNVPARWVEEKAASAFLIGKKYKITDVGTTTVWTDYGAASGTLGEIFTCTYVATSLGLAGDGLAYHVENAGDFSVGRIYQIETAGTTDFTAMGAADNNPGTKFMATGAGSGTGVAIVTSGPRMGDVVHTVITRGGVQIVQRYCMIYDYLNAATNRCFLWESTDGIAFTAIGEVLLGVAIMGATIADVTQAVADGPLTCIVGEAVSGKGYRKRERVSTDATGLVWSDVEVAFDLGTTVGDAHYFSTTNGKFMPDLGDGITRVLVPACPTFTDKPEGNVLIYKPTANLGTATGWTVYTNAMIGVRKPDFGGLWNMCGARRDDGSIAFICNEHGYHYPAALTDDTLKAAIIEKLYFEHDVSTFKHITTREMTSTVALYDPTYWPFAEGDVVQFQGGRGYIAVESTDDEAKAVITTDATDPLTRWVARKAAGFYWTFVCEATAGEATEYALSLNIGNGQSAEYATGIRAGLREILPDARNNQRQHVTVCLIGDDKPKTAALIFRSSQMALDQKLETVAPLVGHPEIVFYIRTT